jgi:hypothetical protein
LLDRSIPFDQNKYEKVQNLYQEFIKEKKTYRKHCVDESKVVNYDQLCAYYRKKLTKISSNSSEITNLSVKIVYNSKSSDKDFLWKICCDGLLRNIYLNSHGKFYMPKRDDAGDIEYMGSTYSLQEIKIHDNF